MARSVLAVGVAALSMAAAPTVDAVYCSLGSGSCTISPCPGSQVESFGTCILSDPTDCPRGCELIENEQRGEPGICGLPGASKSSVTNGELRAIQSCLGDLSADCITENLTLIMALGCTDCFTEFLELQSLNDECDGVAAGKCEETWVPCEGEPARPPRQRSTTRAIAPETGPMMAPGMAPTPGMAPEDMVPMGAPETAAPVGVPTPPGSEDGSVSNTGGGGGASNEQATDGAGGLSALLAPAVAGACALAAAVLL